jgi:deoxyribose-phosphate aldolase
MLSKEDQILLSHVDHTLLKPEASWEQIKKLCDEAVSFSTASVCIPPSFVKSASEYLHGRIPVCTVIGFPNGYHTTSVKCFEASEAVQNGAEEIDMVVNFGWIKEGRFDLEEEEIRRVKEACHGKILKVIIEACLLTREEKIKMCKTVSIAGADFIKTSTGFSSGGATFEDVALLRKEVAPEVRVKAAGGISTLEDARRFLELGADRLGTSRIVRLIQEKNTD